MTGAKIIPEVRKMFNNRLVRFLQKKKNRLVRFLALTREANIPFGNSAEAGSNVFGEVVHPQLAKFR